MGFFYFCIQNNYKQMVFLFKTINCFFLVFLLKTTGFFYSKQLNFLFKTTINNWVFLFFLFKTKQLGFFIFFIQN